MIGSIKKRFASKIVNNGIAMISNMIIGFVLPRNLGPHLYGNYSLVYDTISQTLSFLELRSFAFFYNKLSANYKSRYLAAYSFITIGLIFFVSLLMGSIYFLGINSFFLKGVPLYITLIALAIIIQKWLLDFFTRIYDALGLTLWSEKHKTIFNILFVVLIALCLITNNFSLNVFFALNLVVFIPLLTLLFFKFHKYENHPLVGFYSYQFTFKPIWKSVLKYCSPFLVFLILQLIIALLDRNLLQYRRGSYEQGLYGFSMSLTNIIMIFIAAIIPIFQREIAILNHQKNKAGLCAFYDKTVPTVFLVVCYFVSFIIVNAGDVVELIGGHKFQGSRVLLMISMFSALAACYTNFNNSLLYVLGKFGYSSRLLVYVFPVSLAYSLVLIYYFDLGGIGLVIKTTISEFVMFFLVQTYLGKQIGLNVSKHLLFLIYIFMLFTLVAFLYNLLSSIFSSEYVLVRLLFNGALYTVSLLTLYLFAPKVLMIRDGMGNRLNLKTLLNFSKFKTHDK